MKVLIDTCVWSAVLRRAKRISPASKTTTSQLSELVRSSRVVVIGAVRQELLSGIKEPSQFEAIRDRMQPFDDLVVTTEDYVHAAEISNQCRSAGIAGSNTDFLICSVAMRRDLAIYTHDKDFKRYGKVLELDLFSETQ